MIDTDEILPIVPPLLPFDPDEKIFQDFSEEGMPIGIPYSRNDYIKTIWDLCGINEELLGE